jgi:hypothetical protein
MIKYLIIIIMIVKKINPIQQILNKEINYRKRIMNLQQQTLLIITLMQN